MTNPLATADAPAMVPVADGVEKNRDIERLRAFAVLFVVVAHVSWIQSELAERFAFVIPWTGVDLFFVISGFVVANAFERDWQRFGTGAGGHRRVLGAFYTKRAARILPTAIVALVFWWAGWAFFNRSGSWGGILRSDQIRLLVASNLLFFSNYAMVSRTVIGQLGWYWSLCVEEHFYLLYPSFRLRVPAVRRRAGVLGVIVLVTIFGTRLLSSDPQALQQLSHNRFDQLAFGVLLFLAWQRWPEAGERVRSLLARRAAWRGAATLLAVLSLSAIAAAPTAQATAWMSEAARMRVTLVFTGLLSLILVALASLNLDMLSFGSRWIGRALFALGTRSYALYMYHLPAKWAAQEIVFRAPGLAGGNHPNGRIILLYLLVLAAFVEANFRFIERPFILWARRRVRRLDVAESQARALGRRWPVPVTAATVAAVLVLMVVDPRLVRVGFAAAPTDAASLRDPVARRIKQAADQAAPGRQLFIYAPQEADVARLLPLVSSDPDRFVIGTAEDLARRAGWRASRPLILLFEDRNRDDLQVQSWLGRGDRHETVEGVDVIQLSAGALKDSVRLVKAERLRKLDQELTERIAAAPHDPWLRGVLCADYLPLRDEFPSLYERAAALPSPAPPAGARALGPGVDVYDYRLEPEAGDDAYVLYIFFRATAPLESLTVLVHVIPPPDELANLPESRQPLRYDDWSFSPNPPTTTWSGVAVARTRVSTGLRTAALRIGLRSATRGTIGTVDFEPRAIGRTGA